VDSQDICQSVLANLFAGISAGQFDLETPEQLIKLLVTMARNKLLDHVRKNQAQCRDQRRQDENSSETLDAISDPRVTPSRAISNKELLQKVREMLSEEERYLAEQRALGRGWGELAAELNARPDAIRMRFSRAVNRVARQLGLEEAQP
jgi:RNA polymerase sigma-70 factor (ECF subfamily)